MGSLLKIVVDDPEPTSLPFASSRISPANLAEPSGFRNDLSGFWMLHEGLLKEAVFLVFHVGCENAGEGRSLNEFHNLYANSVVS